TDRKVQIGLKALNADTKYTINDGTEQTLTSSTDMFYTVLEKHTGTTDRNATTITITNTGSGILSITKLKISDDPDAALGQLTQEDLVEALVSLGFEKSAATRFNDISEDKWYYNAVEFVTGRGYFVGVADNLFGPNQTMTRGMFVTVLGRAAKVNKADYADADTGFTDVKSGEYYAPYVAWAKENGIVYGKTETEFCPNMTVTREEMAAFMCRFARYLGLDTTVKDSSWMDRYTDAGAISAYARNSIGWCVETGIITGTSSTTVSPKDLATRAQVATVIKNLVQKVIERK
ncbi:MAG: S-layer homology domain-containing protein, partial [Oscillospiraceae bacterium]|nr:S-layer homology domain-containing protein [Oscillospiraceae bacterium]